MKNTVIVSSPGKLIIGGEHAVVYGRRALVTSIGVRLYMQLIGDDQINESNQRLFNITFHDTNEHYLIDLLHLEDQYPIEIQAILYVYNHFNSLLSSQSQFDLQIHSQIPIGAGLGSSAAFSVCLVGCFYFLHQKKFDQEKINQLAYQVECLFHGTPSGIDNTISTYGQSLIYSRILKKHINFHLSNLAIIDTGIPKSTKRMVELVRLFVENNPIESEEILNDIELCVDTMIEHPEQMNELFQRNQQLLTKLGVSIPEIDNIIQILNTKNISSKITGAGGGGCLIALTSSSMKDELLEMNHIKSIHFVECGVEGLREEKLFLPV
jgi:mevalonate kinase